MNEALSFAVFSLEVEGTFSSYDFSWSLLTSLLVGSQFQFSLNI